jgi:hypothetical protein
MSIFWHKSVRLKISSIPIPEIKTGTNHSLFYSTSIVSRERFASYVIPILKNTLGSMLSDVFGIGVSKRNCRHLINDCSS